MTEEAVFSGPIHKIISIEATPAAVWEALTNPARMKQWMAETTIEIVTSWEVGSPIIIQGNWHSTRFKNTGRVLRFEPGKCVCYSHLSSLSALPDNTENHTIIEFRLSPQQNSTQLELVLSNFPTEAIYRHFAFYWNVALVLLKKMVEQTPG
jgi:uncharacterized protein YndB with AHSA1/START domain